jgi:hypothetical protein
MHAVGRTWEMTQGAVLDACVCLLSSVLAAGCSAAVCSPVGVQALPSLTHA